MTDFMNMLAQRLGFPCDAISSLERDFDTLFADRENIGIFEKYRAGFMNDVADTAPMCEALKAVSEKSGVHIYSVHFLFLMYCAESLHERYTETGLPEEMYFGIMNDLKCKLIECHTVHGIWGTFVFEWFFRHHFALKLFALGRFQYERREFRADFYNRGGVEISKGDEVLAFHIPSSGPITREVRLDSYRKAYEFFGGSRNGKIILTCDSWLLYPDNKMIFPKNSNLSDFMDDFDIIGRKDEQGFSNSWRVFGRDYNGSTEGFPRDTSLQRGFAERLDAGLKTGTGYGVIVFDGEKIVNK